MIRSLWDRSGSVVPLVGALLALQGCIGPQGPIFGDWRGTEQSRDVALVAQVELILDGVPDATSGTYHYVYTPPDTNSQANDGYFRWAGQWDKTALNVEGQSLSLIHLRQGPPGRLADYILLANGSLVPVANPASPDLSRYARGQALRPVPRDTFGYGRP